MGEYAEDYFREEVKEKFGFDPLFMNSEKKKKTISRLPKKQCRKCGKYVRGMADHNRVMHSEDKL